MNNLHILKGSVENLPTGDNIVDGALYFCTDSLEIYEGYIDTSVDPNVKKTRKYNSEKVLVETSGTTVLDACKTDGDYIYITGAGSRNKLTVSTYTTLIDDGTSPETTGFIVTQFIIRMPEVGMNENEFGIFYRIGSDIGDGSGFVWEKFQKCAFGNYDIPDPSANDQVLTASANFNDDPPSISFCWKSPMYVPYYSGITEKSILTTDGASLDWKRAPSAFEVTLYSVGSWFPEITIGHENFECAQTVYINGLSSDDIIFISTDDPNYNLYGIKCVYQNSDMLIFTYAPSSGVPASDIIVKVVRL